MRVWRGGENPTGDARPYGLMGRIRDVFDRGVASSDVESAAGRRPGSAGAEHCLGLVVSRYRKMEGQAGTNIAIRPRGDQAPNARSC